MANNLDLAGRIVRELGVGGDGFAPQFKTLAKKRGSDTGAPYYGVDQKGNEVYLPAQIIYSDANVATGRNTTIDLPYAVVAINSRKIIVETPLTERRGTVKEVIAMGDYELTVRGFCMGVEKVYPEAQVKQLRALYELVGQSVQFIHAVSDVFLLGADRKGSRLCVIRDIQIPDMRGVVNVQPYELSLLSDTPFNLIDLS